MCTCNLSTWEVGAGLGGLTEASLSCMRSCLSNSRFAFGCLFRFKDRAHYVAQASLELLKAPLILQFFSSHSSQSCLLLRIFVEIMK